MFCCCSYININGIGTGKTHIIGSSWHAIAVPVGCIAPVVCSCAAIPGLNKDRHFAYLEIIKLRKAGCLCTGSCKGSHCWVCPRPVIMLAHNKGTCSCACIHIRCRKVERCIVVCEYDPAVCEGPISVH